MSNDLDPMTQVDLRGATQARVVLSDVMASIGSTIWIRDGIVIYVKPPVTQQYLPPPEPLHTPNKQITNGTPVKINNRIMPPLSLQIYRTMLEAGIVSEDTARYVKDIVEYLPADTFDRWKKSTVIVECSIMYRHGFLIAAPPSNLGKKRLYAAPIDNPPIS